MSTAERLRAELLSGNSTAPIARHKVTGAQLAAVASNAPAAARLKAEMMIDSSPSAVPARQPSPHLGPSESADAPAVAEAIVSSQSSIPGLDFEPAITPTLEPVSEPVFEPVSEPASEPVFEPVSEPASERVSEPASEPVLEPVSEPVSELLVSIPAEDPVSGSVDFVETVETTETVPAETITDQPLADPGSSPRGIKRTADEADIPKTRHEADNGEGVQETYEIEEEGDAEEDEEDEDEQEKNLGIAGSPMKPAPLKLLGNNMVEQEDTVR
jgi:hypothetical protein